jgi:hypothetical protein
MQEIKMICAPAGKGAALARGFGWSRHHTVLPWSNHGGCGLLGLGSTAFCWSLLAPHPAPDLAGNILPRRPARGLVGIWNRVPDERLAADIVDIGVDGLPLPRHWRFPHRHLAFTCICPWRLSRVSAWHQLLQVRVVRSREAPYNAQQTLQLLRLRKNTFMMQHHIGVM